VGNAKAGNIKINWKRRERGKTHSREKVREKRKGVKRLRNRLHGGNAEN